MSKQESFARYGIIILRLKKGSATFNEISRKLEIESEIQSQNFDVSLRTFQRDLKDIRSLFDIDIKYDRSRKAYYIVQEEYSIKNERILEAFDTFHALNLTDKISDFIHFEKRKPQGTENWYGMLHALKNNLRIEFSYQKFWEEKPNPLQLEPYAVKEFKNRWYIVGKTVGTDEIRICGFDRLTHLKITNQKFSPDAAFNVNSYFRYSFGIFSSNGQQPEKIVLSFDAYQGKFTAS